MNTEVNDAKPKGWEAHTDDHHGELDTFLDFVPSTSSCKRHFVVEGQL